MSASPDDPRGPARRRLPLGLTAIAIFALSYSGARTVLAQSMETRAVRHLVAEYAIHPLPTDSVPRWSIDTLITRLQSMDPYAAILDNGERADLLAMQEGRLAGVGILLTASQGEAWVDYVIPGGPAATAGVRAGDALKQVDAHLVHPAAVDSLAGWVRGPAGSEVTLLVLRDGDEVRLRVTRQEILVDGIALVEMVSPTVGYVRVDQFAHGTAAGIQSAVARLRMQGGEQLILDLRGNGGGLMDEALQAADLWVPIGRPLAHLNRREAEFSESYFDGTTSAYEAMRLAILIDGGTASAAEILAGALQQEAGAVLVGEQPTYGKGVVQEVFTLPGKRLLRLTTAAWLLPDRTPLQSTTPPLTSRGGGLFPTLLVNADLTLGDSITPTIRRALLRLAQRPATEQANVLTAIETLSADQPEVRARHVRILRELQTSRAPDAPQRQAALRGDPQIAAAVAALESPVRDQH